MKPNGYSSESTADSFGVFVSTTTIISMTQRMQQKTMETPISAHMRFG